MWNLSSLTSDWTHAPCSESTESLPLRRPQDIVFVAFIFLFSGTFLSFIHVGVCYSSSFLFIAKYIPLHDCTKMRVLLLLLLSRFSRVRLCATPETAAHQAPPSLGFSRQEHWSRLPFPSNAWKWKVKVKSLSRVQLFETPWTAAYQAPPSMGFSRQEYWSGVPLPSPWVVSSVLSMNLF